MRKGGEIYSSGKVIVIGGSAGSIPVLNKILCALPKSFYIPVIICVHRMKNVSEGIQQVFSHNCQLDIIEPEDKQHICMGGIYLAPSNYHLLIEKEKTFSLSTDIAVNYSRPSIDVTFESSAKVFKEDLIGVLLTGANSDGANGLETVKTYGGTTVVQEPGECAAPYMPLAALSRQCVDYRLNISEIISLLIKSNES
ncbi:MAG: chemotaxis protein CheB [Bacteroidia bacterium]